MLFVKHTTLFSKQKKKKKILQRMSTKIISSKKTFRVCVYIYTYTKVLFLFIRMYCLAFYF